MVFLDEQIVTRMVSPPAIFMANAYLKEEKAALINFLIRLSKAKEFNFVVIGAKEPFYFFSSSLYVTGK